MAKTTDIASYVLQNYPFPDDMSNARLTKIIYLADWHHTLNNGAQISKINWYYDNYGPFVWDVYNEILADNKFNVKVTRNLFGQEKKLITLNKKSEYALEDTEILSINKVIQETKALYWDKFIKLVYSTFPIRTSEKYTNLNLRQKAKEFKKSKVANG